MGYYRNAHDGMCHACKKRVPSGEGVSERVYKYPRWKTVIWCMPCFNASDCSGEEDRMCGNRAAEDRGGW
jgi:hypothetical protein